MRIFYLDAALTALMSLDMLLHAAAIYDPVNEWAVSDLMGSQPVWS